MLFASLIVFHEALEASLFVGIAAAAMHGLPGARRWLATGVLGGMLGSAFLVWLLPPLRDGLMNIGLVRMDMALLVAALAMLIWHFFYMHRVWLASADRAVDRDQASRLMQQAPWALAAAVAAAVLREGAEAALVLSALVETSEGGGFGALTLHALGGLGLGVFCGWLVFAGLVRIPPQRLLGATMALIALYTASMAGQLAHDAFQAGWLAMPQGPLWDTTALIDGDSVAGTLLHALLGYDGRPTLAQLAGFAGTLVFLMVVTHLLRAPQSDAFPGTVVVAR